MHKTDVTLDLECWTDELSPSQLAVYERSDSERQSIEADEDENSMLSTIYSTCDVKESRPRRKSNDSAEKTKNDVDSKALKRRAVVSNSENDDDDEDLPLAKRALKNKEKNTDKAEKAEKTQALVRKIKGKLGEKEKIPGPNLRPSEVTSVGGLTVGVEVAEDNKTGPDTKEITFNKLHGKTFPSLVVVAKPSLLAKDSSNLERSTLDSKVKIVLMLTPAKFTEWLIQQGLLKSEQKCAIHRENELKLGVYSDGSKFPYSGGYVWISECCPTRFVSVFYGSLFEGAPHPPSCILKLIYHWSCQTNIQNVVQWVKVDNVYIKGIYTWLRAICTLAVHQHFKPMGGPEKYIEVGVISLGTTTQDGQQRQVKVDVLGVLDPAENIIRLRAIEPHNESEKNYKKRFAKILEPISSWVEKDSIITIDLTIDKGTLVAMGYKNIIQSASSDTTAKHTNATVMDYLRRIVPRMFQNTLSLLSRQMIQQFLDELIWREQYGTFPLQTFDNITKHIAEQTKVSSNDTLIHRLFQVATNPFKDWNCPITEEEETSLQKEPSTSGIHRRGRKLKEAS